MPLRLDMVTVSVTDITITTLLGILLVFAWWQNRGTRSLGWWAAAHFVLALGVGALAAGAATNNPVLNDVGLMAMVFAYALMWSAARLFDRREMRPTLVIAGPCGWAVAKFTGLTEAIDTDVSLTSSIFATYNFAAAYEYWRGRAEKLISRWPAIVLLAINGFGFLSWLLLDIWKPISAAGSVYSSEWFATVILITVLGRVALAFIVLAMAKERLELKQRNEALTDSLTGLPNRRAFFRQAVRRMRPGAEDAGPVSVLMFDLDYFKTVNDRYGHAVGDEMLRKFADVLVNNLKATDVIGRVGGEEFAALLPGTDVDGAVASAERIREAFARTPMETAAGTVWGTVSVGVTSVNKPDCSLHWLLRQADLALYCAKENGRDRVHVRPDERRDVELPHEADIVGAEAAVSDAVAAVRASQEREFAR